MQAAHGPNRPDPKPAALEKAKTAVAVLDLSLRCDDSKQACSLLIPGVGKFLDRAREAGVPIWFTATSSEKRTPGGQVATGLHRRESEPLLFPDGFDKFTGGDLEAFLTQHGTDNLVIIGSSTHLCVMYTATTAARSGRYAVLIPIDGVNTANPYEHDYALHQLSVLPGGANKRIQFTSLDGIGFE